MNWNDIPNEMKAKVIRHTTQETRRALGACSKSDKELVSAFQYKTMYAMHIGRLGDSLSEKLSYLVMKDKYHEECKEFDTLEEFQIAVQKKLKEYHFFKSFYVENLDSKVLLQMSSNEKDLKLKSDFLSIYKTTAEVMTDLIRQFEPLYLRKIWIDTKELNEAVLDTPQIKLAEKIELSGSGMNIREDQLMKLNARFLEIENVKIPVNRYIKKCVLEANSKATEFDFKFADVALMEESLRGFEFEKSEKNDDDHSKYRTLATPYSHLKFDLIIGDENNPNCIVGKVKFDSEKSSSLFSVRDKSMLRKVNLLRVHYQNKTQDYEVSVVRKRQPRLFYTFKSPKKAQTKLDEILENTDYIKSFIFAIEKGNRTWSFRPREKLLTVGYLMLRGDFIDQTISNLFEIVEPVFLRKIHIDSELKSTRFFDMPHVVFAEKVHISKMFLTEDQLMKMNAARITNEVISPYWRSNKQRFSGRKNSITEAGINKYFKKCLLNLPDKDYHFLVDGLSDELDEAELFKDLDVISNEPYYYTFIDKMIHNYCVLGKSYREEYDYETHRRIVINSAHQDYIYEVYIQWDGLSAFRVLRNWEEQ